MGKFLVLEGIDGSGKSSVVSELTKRITGNVYQSTEPTHSCIGYLIRELLSGVAYIDEREKCLLYLFLADRIQHAFSINNALAKEDSVVICDRYYHSTFAYQALKYDFKFLDTLHETLPIVLPRPDLVIVLNVTLQTAFDRIGDRRKELFEDANLLLRIQDNYARLKTDSRYCGVDPIVIIDANKSLDEVVDQCLGLYKLLAKGN